MTTLATRVISGKGLVKLDSEAKAFKQARIITTYAQVIREPFNQYLNLNYNPPRSRYAQMVYLRKGYVQFVRNLEFRYQMWEDLPETSAQNMYAIQCAYDGILQTFFNLGNALLLPSISITDHIKDWVHPNLFWDEIKVVCYADTAIQITVECLTYDLCPEQEDKEGAPPPPPPPNVPGVPPGTPLPDTDYPVSDPYEGDDDNGDTIPYPIDIPEPPPEFPIGVQCDTYNVAVQGTVSAGGSVQNNSIVVFGKVEYAGLDLDNPNQIVVIAYGDALAPGAFCRSNPQKIVLLGSSSGYVSGSVSYTVTPY